MNPRETSHRQSLVAWLDVATAKLGVPAKERIRTEIKAHFADAVEAHVADGLTEAEAQAAALAELGDADAAAKRFRREYITESEAKWLTRSLKHSRAVIWILVEVGAVAIFIRVMGNRHHVSLRIQVLTTVLCAFMALSSFILARREMVKQNLQTFLLVHVLNLMGWLSICFFYFCPDWVMAVAVSWQSVGVHLFRVCKVWRKLKDTANLPPVQPT